MPVHCCAQHSSEGGHIMMLNDVHLQGPLLVLAQLVFMLIVHCCTIQWQINISVHASMLFV